jgi:hypothetical protein
LGRTELARAHAAIAKLLDRYEHFLKMTNAAEAELVARFMVKETSRAYLTEAYEFGDLVFDALNSIGGGNRFHRLMVV